MSGIEDVSNEIMDPIAVIYEYHRLRDVELQQQNNRRSANRIHQINIIGYIPSRVVSEQLYEEVTSYLMDTFSRQRSQGDMGEVMVKFSDRRYYLTRSVCEVATEEARANRNRRSETHHMRVAAKQTEILDKINLVAEPLVAFLLTSYPGYSVIVSLLRCDIDAPDQDRNHFDFETSSTNDCFTVIAPLHASAIIKVESERKSGLYETVRVEAGCFFKFDGVTKHRGGANEHRHMQFRLQILLSKKARNMPPPDHIIQHADDIEDSPAHLEQEHVV